MRSSLQFPALTALATLASCGGDTSPSGTLVVNAPPPAPAPTPVPTPMPTPTPTPLPGPYIAGTRPGTALVGVEACARDQVTRDANGRITGLTLTAAKTDNSLRITYSNFDSYSLDANGFGGPSFAPADKQPWTGGPYDRFVSAQRDEFYIFRDGQYGSATFATLGADYHAGACYFAVGAEANSRPTFLWEYFGRIDGLARIGARTLRLFDHGAKIISDAKGTSGTLQLKLVGRESPFGDFHAQLPASIATVEARVSLLPDGRLDIGPLSGGGFSGSANGHFVATSAMSVGGSGGAGAVFAFQLRNAQNDIIFGVVAADANLI